MLFLEVLIIRRLSMTEKFCRQFFLRKNRLNRKKPKKILFLNMKQFITTLLFQTMLQKKLAQIKKSLSLEYRLRFITKTTRSMTMNLMQITVKQCGLQKKLNSLLQKKIILLMTLQFFSEVIPSCLFTKKFY